MTIDISKIRPGDEVTVRGIVVERHDLPHHRGFRLHVFKDDGSYHDPFVPFAAIVSHTPKELQPGDRVRKLVPDICDLTGEQRVYTITAIDDDGWMLLADRGPGARVTTSRDFVERVQ